MPTRRQMFRNHPFPWMFEPGMGKGSEHSDSISLPHFPERLSGTLIGHFEYDPINEDLRIVPLGYCYSCFAIDGIKPIKSNLNQHP